MEMIQWKGKRGDMKIFLLDANLFYNDDDNKLK